MPFFWKTLLWLSDRPHAVQNYVRIPAGVAMVPALYAALLFLLHKSVEESVVKAIEVQVPTWYWYVLIGVCSACVSGWLTKLFHEADRGTLKRKAAGFTITLARRRIRSERNRHATNVYGRIEPHGALAIDLVATLHATHHLRNVTRVRAIISDLRGTAIVDSEIAERFRNRVNRGDAAEFTVMTVYRPQDSVTGTTAGERSYKLVGLPEMTPLPQVLGEITPIIDEAKYRVTIEVLHTKGNECASFITDLSLDILDLIELGNLSPLVQMERSPPAGPNDFFAMP